MAGFYHNDVQTGATVAGLSHCDVQFGRTYNAGILEQDGEQTNLTHGTAPNYFSGSDSKDWGRIGWKVTKVDDLVDGTLKVYVHVSYAWAVDTCKLGLAKNEWYDPDLTGGSSTQNVVTGGNYSFDTNIHSTTWQTGYFGMVAGWAGWNISARITKLTWRDSQQNEYLVWQEGIQGTMNHSCVRFT